MIMRDLITDLEQVKTLINDNRPNGAREALNGIIAALSIESAATDDAMHQLLLRLDATARAINMYDFGLPLLRPDHKEQLLDVVRQWFAHHDLPA